MRSRELIRFDIGLLFALDALLRFENVSQAARELGLSQPALSTRLSRLRELFGDKLFVPSTSGRGIAPTPRAEALRPQVSDLLLRLGAMVSPPDAFDPAHSERTFVIGLYRNPSAMLAPDLLPYVIAVAPNVRIGFVWPHAAAVLDQLESGAVDLVLGSDMPVHGDIVARTLLQEPLLTAQRADHPRGRHALDLDTFCAMPHVVVSEDGASFQDSVDRELAALKRSRRVVASLQSYAVVPRVVERSDCLCTLPSGFLARYGAALDVFEPPLALGTVKLCAFWHPRLQEDAGHAWLRHVVLDVVRQAQRR